jgi:hypothetical protein
MTELDVEVGAELGPIADGMCLMPNPRNSRNPHSCASESTAEDVEMRKRGFEFVVTGLTTL